MTAKLQTMRERIAVAAAEWTSVDDETGAGPIMEGARQKRAEETRQREAEAERRKAIAQYHQYETTNNALIAEIIGANPDVERLETAINQDVAALDAMRNELERIHAQCQVATREDDLQQVSIGDLFKSAFQLRKKQADEIYALMAVQSELERRVGLAEAALAEKRSALLRLKRVALHQHCDYLIQELHDPIFAIVPLLTKLRQAEDFCRGMGGVRQAFLTRRLSDTLEHTVARWNDELIEIKRFSEQY